MFLPCRSRKEALRQRWAGSEKDRREEQRGGSTQNLSWVGVGGRRARTGSSVFSLKTRFLETSLWDGPLENGLGPQLRFKR